MLRLDHKKLAERILAAKHIDLLEESLEEKQENFVRNILQSNTSLTPKQEIELKWLYARKVDGKKVYYSDIRRDV